MCNSALREKFNSRFQGRFLLVLVKFSFREKDWALGINSMKFWDFSEVLSRLTTRKVTPIYQFFTINHALFHLWWKENLLNYQKVLNHYELDCSSFLSALEVFASLKQATPFYCKLKFSVEKLMELEMYLIKAMQGNLGQSETLFMLTH